MSRIRTRQQLLNRLDRYSKKKTVSNDDRESRRAYLDDAYARTFSYLSSADDGFGQVRIDTTLQVATFTHPLPSNFRSLRVIVVNPGQNQVLPTRVSELESQKRYPDGSSFQGSYAIGYQVEGPGEDWDGTEFQPYDQRIRFTTELPSGTVLRTIYVQQPPSLADPSGEYTDSTQDPLIKVDCISEPIEEAIIAYARIWNASRGDDSEYSRARASLQEVANDYLKERSGRNGYGVYRADSYTSRPHGGGY